MGKVHSVSLPAACRVIGKQAFEGCQFQKQVRFPDTLIEIQKKSIRREPASEGSSTAGQS